MLTALVAALAAGSAAASARSFEGATSHANEAHTTASRHLSAIPWPDKTNHRTLQPSDRSDRTYYNSGGSYCGYESTSCCAGGRCLDHLVCYSGACAKPNPAATPQPCGALGQKCCIDGDACEAPLKCRVDTDGMPKCANPPEPEPHAGSTSTGGSDTSSAGSVDACPTPFALIRDRPHKDLSTLSSLLESAGLSDALSDPEAQLTVFAPTDDAFAALGDGVLAALRDDVVTLKKILSLHVAKRAVSLQSLTNGGTMSTLSGATVTTTVGSGRPINLASGQVTVAAPADGSAATVVEEHVCTSVVYIVDGVLVPGDVQLPGA